MKKIIIKGECLTNYCGKIEISPARRLVMNFFDNGKPGTEIPLALNNARTENHTITIANKIRVVEHLFSALYGLEIFKVKIDFYSNEVPFFDGSSSEFVKILSEFCPEQNSEYYMVNKKISIEDKNAFIVYDPTDDNQLLIEMELEHPYIGKQHFRQTIDRDTYISEIARARTFVFTDESDPRLKNLPPYGIGITKNGIHSREPLRFPDEPVRHKILDLLGDLYFLQKKLYGKIKARNTSHKLNLGFVRKLLSIQ